MPSPNISQTPSNKPSARADDASTGDASKSDPIKSVAQRLEASADHATRAAADKAMQVRDQVQSTASALQNSTGQLVQGAVDRAAKLNPELAEGARHLSNEAKHAVEHAVHTGSALAQQARDAAIDTYDSAHDYALETAHDLSDRAQRAGRQTASYLQRASIASGRFATVHALPLTFVGAGLGWLAWSVLREARRPLEFDVEMPRPTRARRSAPAARRSVAPVVEPRLRSSGVTTGDELMGVRGRERGYDDDVWTP